MPTKITKRTIEPPAFPLAKERSTKGSRRLAREKVFQVLVATAMSNESWRECFQHIVSRDYVFDAPAAPNERIMAAQEVRELESDTPIAWDDVEMLYITSLLAACERYGEFTDELINRFSKHWDIDRTAVIDRSLINLACAEILSFPEIPLEVTINEVIVIAKQYSTEKSAIYVNGLMDAIVKELVAREMIKDKTE